MQSKRKQTNKDKKQTKKVKTNTVWCHSGVFIVNSLMHFPISTVESGHVIAGWDKTNTGKDAVSSVILYYEDNSIRNELSVISFSGHFQHLTGKHLS